MEDKQAQALEMIKAVHDDKCAEINGRKYVIGNLNHEKRVQVFAYFTKIKDLLNNGDFSFLTDPEFKKIEELISRVVTYEDSALIKLPDHWDKYTEDYVQFVSVMMPVISYPFLKGRLGD